MMDVEGLFYTAVACAVTLAAIHALNKKIERDAKEDEKFSMQVQVASMSARMQLLSKEIERLRDSSDSIRSKIEELDKK